jgi:CTP synthase
MIDIVITEIGGTVGDIESLPYIESVRQLVWELESITELLFTNFSACCRWVENKANTAFSKTLMEIKADILVCRTEHEISEE